MNHILRNAVLSALHEIGNQWRKANGKPVLQNPHCPYPWGYTPPTP